MKTKIIFLISLLAVLVILIMASCEKDSISDYPLVDSVSVEPVIDSPEPSISGGSINFNGIKKIQKFEIGESVVPGDVFYFLIGSMAVSITASATDTPKSIAYKLSTTINGARISGIRSYTYSWLPSTFGVEGLSLYSFHAFAYR